MIGEASGLKPCAKVGTVVRRENRDNCQRIIKAITVLVEITRGCGDSHVTCPDTANVFNVPPAPATFPAESIHSLRQDMYSWAAVLSLHRPKSVLLSCRKRSLDSYDD
jgi:hypothetical protein